VIPTAIVAGFLLGLWLRGWAVPIVAVAWAAIVVVTVDAPPLAAAALGAVNALLGAALAVLLRRAPTNRRAQ
jgi:hypothetical protein